MIGPGDELAIKLVSQTLGRFMQRAGVKYVCQNVKMNKSGDGRIIKI